MRAYRLAIFLVLMGLSVSAFGQTYDCDGDGQIECWGGVGEECCTYCYTDPNYPYGNCFCCTGSLCPGDKLANCWGDRICYPTANGEHCEPHCYGDPCYEA